MATSVPYNVANGSAGPGATTLTLTVGVGAGSPTGKPAGDAVAVWCSDGLATTTFTVTDTAGNVYTDVLDGSGAQRQHLFMSPGGAVLSAVGAPDTITVTSSSSTGNKIAHALGIPGLAVSGGLIPLDRSNSAAATSTAPSSGSSGGPLGQASEVVLGCIRNASGGGTPTGLSFGSALAVTQSAIQTEFHEVVSATTAQTASGTIASALWSATVATFAISLPVIQTTSLPNAVSGNAYSQTLSVSGGLPSYTWAVTGGSLTGSGLTLSSPGVLSGTASTAGTYNFTATVTDGNGNTDPQALTVIVTGGGAGAFTRVQAGAAASGTGSVAPVISASTAGNLLVAALSAPAAGQFTAPAGWQPAVQAGGGGGLMGERNKTFDVVTGAGVTGMSSAISYIGSVSAASTGTVVEGVPTTWPASAYKADVKIQIFDYQPNLTDGASGTLDTQHTGFFNTAPAGSWVMPYHEPGVGSGNNPTGAQIIALDRHLIALKNRVAPGIWYVRGMATLGGAVDTSVWIDYGQSFTATNAAPAVFTSSPALDSAPNGMSVILKGGSLPAGFTANTVYYVVNASGTTFQLSATIGGAGKTSTSTGSGTVVPVPDAFGLDGYQHNNQNHSPSDSFSLSVSNILAASPVAKIAIIETGTAVGSVPPQSGQATLTPVQGVTAWLNAIGAYAQANPSIFSVNTYWAYPGDTPGAGTQVWSNSFAPAEQALSNVMAAGGTSDVEIWYYPNCPVGITTATFTGPGGANCRGAIAEFSSPAGTSQALDGPGGATGAAAPPLVTSLPVTAQQSSTAGDLGICAFGNFFSGTPGGSWTTPAGWTVNAASAAASNLFAFYEKTGLGAGVQSVTGLYSTSVGQTSWAGAIATFSQVFSAPVIQTASLPGGTVGAAYPSTTMTATGGTLPYTWSASAGKPPGLLLSSAGVWSGTPATQGSYTFTVTVTDLNNATGSKQFTAVVVASGVTITTSGLPGGTVGTPYSAPNMASAGGTAPYTWTVTSGTLPAGVALSAGGVWSGTPSTPAAYSFTIMVTDGNGSTAPAGFTVTIAPSGTPPPPPAPTAFPGAPLGILVELQVNSTWNDITGYMYYRDGINITGGTSQQGTTPSPAQCTMTLDNRDGRFSPGTPDSIAAWGGDYIKQGIQLRVSVTATSVTGVHYSGYRFWGKVSEFPPQSDISGNDVYVQITANGPLREIQQGGGKGGALTRYYHTLDGTAYAPAAYWPCEEDTSASFIDSGVYGGQVMQITGTPLWKGSNSFNGSAPMPVINKSTWDGLTGDFGSSGDDVYATPGTYTWIASTSQVQVTCVGGGGGGAKGQVPSGGGNGGGGGEIAQEPVFTAVTPGVAYQVVVGAGGQAGDWEAGGQNGGLSSFTGDGGATVTAHGGKGATANGSHGSTAAGGTGSSNTTHHNGGTGGYNAGGFNGGAGGGGAGGLTGNGGNASNSQSGSTAPGGNPGSGGGGGFSGNTGHGGYGGYPTPGNPGFNGAGSGPGLAPGGGGGGGWANQSDKTLGSGGGTGSVELVYTPADKGVPPPIDVVRFLMQTPLWGSQNGAVLLRFFTDVTVAGSNLTHFDVVMTGAGLQLKGFTGAGLGSLNFTSGTLGITLGLPVMVSVEVSNNTSGGVKYIMRAIVAGAATVLGTVSGTVTSSVIGNVTEVIVSPNGDITKTAIGHVSVQYAFVPLSSVSDAINGHYGEMGLDRFIRLCSEQGLDNITEVSEGSDHWGFEGGVQSWTGSNCTLATSAFSIARSFPLTDGWPVQGTQSLKLTSTAGGVFSASSPAGIAGQPVVPGDVVTAAADVVTAAAGVTSAYTAIQFWTAKGAAIGSPVTGTAISLTANTPQTVRVKTIAGGAPATAAFFSIITGDSDGGAAAGTVLYVDNVRISTRMGTQTREAYADHLEQLKDAEQGILKEARELWGLKYRTRITLHNQPVALTLDYAKAQVAPPLQPVHDDKLTVTDVTVKRTEGSRVTLSQSAGTVTTGARFFQGHLRKNVKVVLEDDAQLLALADHLLNLGTDTSTRYPVITVNLARTTTAPLFADVASVEIGDRVQILNLPSWMPDTTADQLVIGYTETLNYNVWTIAWNCTPATPWTINITNTRRW